MVSNPVLRVAFRSTPDALILAQTLDDGVAHPPVVRRERAKTVEGAWFGSGRWSVTLRLAQRAPDQVRDHRAGRAMLVLRDLFGGVEDLIVDIECRAQVDRPGCMSVPGGLALKGP